MGRDGEDRMTVQRVWQVELVSDQGGETLVQPSRGMVRLTSGWHPVDPQALFAHFAGGDLKAAVPMNAFAVQPAPADRVIVPSKEVFSCDGIQCFELDGIEDVGAGDMLVASGATSPLCTRAGEPADDSDISEHLVAFDTEDQVAYFEAFQTGNDVASARLRMRPRRRLRMWVVRLVAKLAGKLLGPLERRLRRERLVSLSANGKVGDPAELDLGQDPNAPLLVLIHGFVATTESSFGDLLADGGKWGAIHRRYAGVVGWDHPTISADLEGSAHALADRLRRLPDIGQRPIHLLCASQGALVGRALVSSAGTGLGPIEHVVMVASPAAGTVLAAPDTLNRVVEVGTLLLIEHSHLFGPFLATLLLILRSIAVNEEDAPGVVAMVPGSRFLTGLRDSEGGEPPVHAGAMYHLYVSDFEAEEDSEFWITLKRRARDLFGFADDRIDAFFGDKPNDLVVDRATVARLRAAVGQRVANGMERDKGPHHLQYYRDEHVLAWVDGLLNGNRAGVVGSG